MMGGDAPGLLGAVRPGFTPMAGWRTGRLRPRVLTVAHGVRMRA